MEQAQNPVELWIWQASCLEVCGAFLQSELPRLAGSYLSDKAWSVLGGCPQLLTLLRSNLLHAVKDLWEVKKKELLVYYIHILLHHWWLKLCIFCRSKLSKAKLELLNVFVYLWTIPAVLQLFLPRPLRVQDVLLLGSNYLHPLTMLAIGIMMGFKQSGNMAVLIPCLWFQVEALL